MRLPRRTVSLCLLSVLTLSLGASAGERDPVADGLPVIAGTWTGKIKFKFFPLDPIEDKDSGSVEATLSIEQKGSGLAAGLDVISDDGPQHWDLAGVIGNSNFWLAGGEEGAPVFLSGHVKGKLPKLKGVGVVAGPAELNDIKFSLVPAQF